MSSTKHPRHRRCARGIVAAGAAAWLFAATGCGLQPLHGQRSAANSEALATVDIRPIDSSGDGYEFCRQLPAKAGVVAIPNEVFYARPDNGRHMVRFAYCKQMHVINAAADALAKGFAS